ncbi:MAG: FMN-binding negative transcriptional regulator [Nitrososphaerota archaeon]|nr:FMN-binding negative transcriptional regulator [Nitrososphaerota archaeon]MDG7023952.1 FMN-binding negative transcriptional regulator [Nitrososphaerota archaeon]
MYAPRWFKEDKIEVLQAEINKTRLGTIITAGPSGIMASHVPMLIDPTKGRLGNDFAPSHGLNHLGDDLAGVQDFEKRGPAFLIHVKNHIANLLGVRELPLLLQHDG